MAVFTRQEFVRATVAAAGAAALNTRAFCAPLETPLDRYIALPTPEYDFEIVAQREGKGVRSTLLSMVSQRWRSRREVDKPVWRHWLTITEPQHVRTRIALLIISGGSTNDRQPKAADAILASVATRIGAVVAELRTVPNEPLQFTDERTARAEDDLIAYSWDKYLRTGDETWPLRLPMTKSAVRAMDTVSTFARTRGLPVDRFIVGGTSKRGWTAWLTAAADRRVVALVPTVIDVLNIKAQAEHAHAVYGSWPEALAPYEKMGIMKWLGTPQFDALVNIEDPYAYRQHITVPKLIVNASGDQYFTPDSSQFYYTQLVGEKYLRYLPNTDHSLKGAVSGAVETGLAFVDSIIDDSRRPRYSWRVDGEESLLVQTAARPLAVRLWQATNPRTRDFRLQTIGRAFTASGLRDRGDQTYVAHVAPPAHGFTAYFVELAFATTARDIFTLTTDVHVVPDTLPFAHQAQA